MSAFIYRCVKCGRRATLVHEKSHSLGSWKCAAHGPCRVERSKNKDEEEAA